MMMQSSVFSAPTAAPLPSTLLGQQGRAAIAAGGPEGCVLLVYSEQKKKHYIIVRIACSTRAQLVRIHPESGVLNWDQAVGRDSFESESAALKFLQDQSRTEVLAHGKAVLGYTVLGPVALLLVAEAVRVSAVLPGGHQIKTVTQSRWHRINLQQPELDPITQAAMKAELDRGLDKTTAFPVDGAHYFCETLDITRPFPSPCPSNDNPSWPFVWNKALSAPFRAAGLDGAANTVCPPLLQGMAESRELEDFDGCRFSYCLISRRCRLHVGPRYKARGLNDNADPGNEIECDQVVWKHSASPDKPLAWSRYTWRRGSVPLWWSVTIRNGGMGEAEIKLHSTNTFRGSRRYVRRLQRRYTPNPALEPPPDDADGTTASSSAAAAAAAPAAVGSKDWREQSLQVPVVFFSLLRKGTPDRDRSEAKLAEAFDYLAGQLRSLHKLPVGYVALDWHQMDKELGSEALVEAFWTQLSALLPPQGFALGTMSKVGPDHTEVNAGLELGAAGDSVFASAAPDGTGSSSSSAAQQGYSSAGQGWRARWFKQQQGVTRYNCADSLDRTNVGSFFGAVQVFVEQCRELDIAIAASSAGAASMARQAMLRRQAAAAAAAAADDGGGGGAAAAPAGRPPLAVGSLAALGQQQDSKRLGTAGSTAAGGSSGFLSSLGKGLIGGVKDMRLNPTNNSSSNSPRGAGGSSDMLGSELRSSSSPNIALMARGSQQQQQQQQQSSPPSQQQQQQDQQRQQEVPLPAGWEAKYDAVNKRVFYVDHNTKTTTWTRPQAAQQQQAGSSGSPPNGNSSSGGQQQQDGGSPAAAQQGSSGAAASSSQVAAAAGQGKSRPGSSSRIAAGEDGSDSDSEKAMYEPLTPWCMFSPRLAKVRRFARMINPAALSAIAELFLMNGDMCAWLYTGSPAMHSEKITLFEPETSRLKKAGAGTYGNSFIAIRRRYNNVVMDDERKTQADIFLGLKTRLYFPTLPLPYREVEGPPSDDYPESDEDAVQQQQRQWEQARGVGVGGSIGSISSSTSPRPQPHQQQHKAGSSSGGGNFSCGGTHDPLGDLTWPLETSKHTVVSRGASSHLLSLGQGVSSSAAAAAAAAASAAGAGISSLLASANRGGGGSSSSKSAERQRAATSSQLAEDGSEALYVDTNRGHTRSFSSEKLFEQYRAQQQQTRSSQPSPAAGAAAAPAAVPVVSNGSSSSNGGSAAAAAVQPAPQASAFDEELPDGAPSPSFSSPLGGGVTLSDPLGVS